MSERWETVDEIREALDRFESAIDGYRRPAVYGIGWADAQGTFEVTRVNLSAHPLPAAVLATTCRYASGTESYALDRGTLADAVADLAPAEACDAYDHPNLAAWRHLLHHAPADGTIIAVFVDDLDTDHGDPYVRAMIAAALVGRQENSDGTTTLWRPTGPAELSLVEQSGWKEWPPRLDDQPIFYPVLSREYALQIAREWNVPASGAGYVTRFGVDTAYARTLPTQQVGGRDKLELWVPADRLPEFNAHIVGDIQVTDRLE